MSHAPRRLLVSLLFCLPMLAAAKGGCNPPDGNSTTFSCECWSESSAGLTIGTPSPCAETTDEAKTAGETECSEEVGESCTCECTQTGESC